MMLQDVVQGPKRKEGFQLFIPGYSCILPDSAYFPLHYKWLNHILIKEAIIV